MGLIAVASLPPRARESTSQTAMGQLVRVSAPDDELKEKKLGAKARRKSATVQGDRFPMPDKEHAKLALEFLPRAKDLSDEERAKIKARAHSILGKKESVAVTSGALRERLTFHPRFIESSFDAAKRTAEVIIITEGVGNRRDKHYYGPDTIEQAVRDGVFEGAQAYADHPGLDEDINRPERSVRDLFGYYFNTRVVESNGKKSVAASLKIQEGADWAIGLIKEAIEYNKKFPSKAYVGISINADGDVQVEELNGQAVNYVKRITEAFSADMVTKPARGGKFLALRESAGGARNKGETVTKKELLESAARLKSQIASGSVDKDELDSVLTALAEAKAPIPADGALGEAMCEAHNKKDCAECKETREADVEPDGDADDNEQNVVGKKESKREAKRESQSTGTNGTQLQESDSTEDLKKKYPTLYAAALQEAQAGVKDDIAEMRKRVSTLEAEKALRESVDLAKSKLKESGLPEASARRILQTLVGKTAEEMDSLIEAESDFLKMLGVDKGARITGTPERNVQMRESESRANRSVIFAGME